MVVKVHPKVLVLRILKASLNEGLPYRTLLREMRKNGSGREAAMAAIGELNADGCVEVRSVSGSKSAPTKNHFITKKGAELLLRYISTEPFGTHRS